ncbi:MarR family transcriptional regulator [Roseibium hamelinense]|uniref:MarR family transcriptional regulator n=1 Tax=Roseibium hamelinense TaxID=150831 RepID=A0A562SYR9_9HYPH|nr:MarR family winged helix-turn-helix transcriptional regulator [Roseibium hamelinense]MTI43626.1 MarR family transcriptional regulator [Roseibium hamelinense]TWI86144.1 MarR family transcriptional regulator [Roseibium hamelinense]
MTDTPSSQSLRDLIDRLSRLSAAEDWNGPLNPSQFAALSFLSRANRFSRAPSHVADYLATTRGTASQTLKALARKDLITEERSSEDKRRIRYDVSSEGLALLHQHAPLDHALDAMDCAQREGLEAGLRFLIGDMLRQRGGKTFGICKTCVYHDTGSAIASQHGYCRLLGLPLSAGDPDRICHEHKPPAEVRHNS